MHIQYIHNKYMRIYISNLEISCTLYVYLYMINFYMSKIHTFCHFSLTKLMVSHDLQRSTLTYRTTFDQQNSKSMPNFQRPMDRCCQASVSRSFFWFPNWKPWIPSVITDLQTLHIFWKLVIYKKSTGKKHKISRVRKSLIFSSVCLLFYLLNQVRVVF